MLQRGTENRSKPFISEDGIKAAKVFRVKTDTFIRRKKKKIT